MVRIRGLHVIYTYTCTNLQLKRGISSISAISVIVFWGQLHRLLQSLLEHPRLKGCPVHSITLGGYIY